MTLKVELGSVLISAEGTIGIVIDEKFNSHPLNREIGDFCWDIRTTESRRLVTKSKLSEIGYPQIQWSNTGLFVNHNIIGVEAFTLSEIKILASGAKIPHVMSKTDFIHWAKQTLLLAREQRKFGVWKDGSCTAKSVLYSIEQANLFYFDFTDDEQKHLNNIVFQIERLGYNL